MINSFSGREIIDIGIQIEKNGRDFYCKVATKTKNEQAKIIFNHLANEEEKHIIVFQNIRQRIEKNWQVPELNEEYFAYMNALAQEYVFTDEEKVEPILKFVNDDLAAIDLGIKFEKDSLIFYQGMKKMGLDKNKEILEELLRQEQMHLEQLYNLKRKLKQL